LSTLVTAASSSITTMRRIAIRHQETWPGLNLNIR